MKKLSILIVEDEILIGELIKEYLCEAGHQVTNIAISYDEALREFNLQRPDLILLDIRLYGAKSGIEFARFLESHQEHLPIIYLSSQFDQKTMSQALETNPYGYLTKPINKETLWTTIHAAYGLFESKFQTVNEIELFDGKSHHRVKTDDIIYIEAEHVYLNVVLINQKSITVRQSLKNILNDLADDNMIQCHRSYIVNQKHIKSWNTSLLKLINDKEIPVSRNYNIFLNK